MAWGSGWQPITTSAILDSLKLSVLPSLLSISTRAGSAWIENLFLDWKLSRELILEPSSFM